MEVRLAGLNSPPRKVIEHVARHLTLAFSARVTIGPCTSRIPQRYLNPLRNQYRAPEVLRWAAQKFKRSESEALLTIADGDAYVEGLNFVFGLATPHLRAAVVFLRRLKTAASEQLLLQRALKEAMHELGHAFGLSHCRSPGCVMRFSNSVLEVDRKSWRYCSRCFTELASRGVNVRHEALLK